MWSLSEPWGIQTCQNFLSTTHFCLGKCETAPPSDLVQNRGPPRGAAVFLTGGKIECENGPVHLFRLPPAASCRISSPAWWFLSTTTVSSSPPSRSAWFFETCNSCPAWPRRCVDGFCCLKIPLNLCSCYFIKVVSLYHLASYLFIFNNTNGSTKVLHWHPFLTVTERHKT